MSDTAVKRRAPAAKPGRGRPCLYTPEIAAEICARLSEGETLQSICRDEHMPAVSTVNEWSGPAHCRPKHVPATFSVEFARAREVGHDAIAAEALVIADTLEEGVETVTKADGTVEERRGDMLGHRKLRIETRLKLLAKWSPKKYGEKMAVGGADDLPAIKTDTDPADVARRVAFILTAAMRKKQQAKD